MEESNPPSTFIEENIKLEKWCKEEKVDSKTFKQIIGSLIYLFNSTPSILFFG